MITGLIGFFAAGQSGEPLIACLSSMASECVTPEVIDGVPVEVSE